jgi:hypothetical protein
MMNQAWSLALPLLALIAPAWAADRTLCQASEKVLWSCHAAKKTYSVCASADLSAAKGYLQYRAGSPDKLEFTFPAARAHPAGRFHFETAAHGGRLSFSNANVTYTIYGDALGLPEISVEKDGTPIATVRCKDETGDLLANPTLDLFAETRISK